MRILRSCFSSMVMSWIPVTNTKQSWVVWGMCLLLSVPHCGVLVAGAICERLWLCSAVPIPSWDPGNEPCVARCPDASWWERSVYKVPPAPGAFRSLPICAALPGFCGSCLSPPLLQHFSCDFFDDKAAKITGLAAASASCLFDFDRLSQLFCG